jgi:hypothetical protein
MNVWKRIGFVSPFALLAGLASTIALAALWHLFGGAWPPTQAGYRYTEYFTACLTWPFAAAYFILSIALGWTVRRRWPVALGMMLPLPLAFVIEVVSDPTSHNLVPLEVLLYWLPALGLALLGGYLGEIIAARLTRKEMHQIRGEPDATADRPRE